MLNFLFPLVHQGKRRGLKQNKDSAASERAVATDVELGTAYAAQGIFGRVEYPICVVRLQRDVKWRLASKIKFYPFLEQLVQTRNLSFGRKERGHSRSGRSFKKLFLNRIQVR
jgi:hypothetical protein